MRVIKSILPEESELGQLIFQKNWEKSPLGRIEGWSQTLKSSLGLILHSKFPMYLFWGSEATGLYNDAYREILGQAGKHPQILGQSGKDAWPEIWETISPLIDQVMTGQGSCFFEDMLIPIYRNGEIQDVYWTFSYSPAFDEIGDIVGVVVTCVETTKTVLQAKRSEESANELSRILRQAPVSIVSFKGANHVVEMVNPMAARVMGSTEQELAGKSLFESFPEFESQGFRQVMDTVLKTKEPYVSEEQLVQIQKDGKEFEIYMTFNYEPTFNAEGEVDGVIVVGTDITESRTSRIKLRQAFEKIEESERQFRILADSMPQFVWTSDAEGRLNYFNEAVSAYSGIKSKELTGEGWLEIVHPDERELNVQKWTESIKTGNDFLFEHRFERYDGEYRWQLSRAVPERDDEGNIKLWIGTSTDIQRIKEQELEKDIFIGMASHELKTPVTSIKGYIDMLLSMHEESEDIFLKESLSIINRQLETMVDLIADMLDLSKMKAGAITLNKEHFRVKDMIHEVLDEMKYTNPSQEFKLSEGGDVLVYGDQARLSQVLVNFLTNAIKYSPGGDTIVVSFNQIEGDIRVSVRDTGIGIKKKDQKMIFNRFYRVEGKNEKTFPGFGIGLYIAADIIRRHHGKIGVKSKIGEGSEFYFLLPVK